MLSVTLPGKCMVNFWVLLFQDDKEFLKWESLSVEVLTGGMEDRKFEG